MRNPKLSTSRTGLFSLLDEMIQTKATALHLKAPEPPLLRVGGVLQPLSFDPLTPQDTHAMKMVLLELGKEEAASANFMDKRVMFGVEGKGRFRAQLLKQRGSTGIVLSRIPMEAPDLERLPGLRGVGDIFLNRPGLTLVAGGQVRSRVLAGFISHFNYTRKGHIVSLEDPIDCLHRDNRAVVSQREVGSDVGSFAEGLEAALRQDVDAIVVSDVRTEADAELVLRAAEEGLRVVAGLSTAQSREAVRVFGWRFPHARGEEILSRLATVLLGVVAVPREGDPSWCPIDEAERARFLGQAA